MRSFLSVVVSMGKCRILKRKEIDIESRDLKHLKTNDSSVYISLIMKRDICTTANDWVHNIYSFESSARTSNMLRFVRNDPNENFWLVSHGFDVHTMTWYDYKELVRQIEWGKPGLSWQQTFFFGDVAWWWSGFFKVKCAAGFLIEINFQLENVVVQVPCNTFSIHFVANIWFSSTISLSRLNDITNDVITKPYEQP